MIKNKLLDIKQKVLKQYIGTFCESANENEAVLQFRKIIGLDDSYESSYKIEDYSKNIVISFTNGDDVIEIKFYAEVGGAISYSITVNDNKVSTRLENDDKKNLIKLIANDRILKDDLALIKGDITTVDTLPINRK